MAVTDTLRHRLEGVAPATSGTLSESEFLLTGAGAGALGWSGTQVLTWVAPTDAAVLATALWVALLAGFAGITLLRAPDAIRFSDPMFVWAGVNGTAMVLTLGGLLGAVEPTVAFWAAWVGAAAVGYGWTGGLLEGADQARRGRGYLVASLAGLCLLVAGVFLMDLLEPAAYLLLGGLRVVPLALDAIDRG